MMPLSLALMRRYATSRRGFTAVVSGFALVGIMLGVAALIVVMCVMAGFRAELLDRILGVSGHGTVFVHPYDNTEITTLMADLSAQDGIVSVTPYLQGQVMALNNAQTAGALVRGLDAADLPDLLTTGIADNQLALFADPNQVAIGVRMARTLGVRAGDGLTLLSSDGAYTPFGFVPRIVQARVAFVFETGSSLYDQGLMLTNRAFAQRMFKTQQAATALEFRVSAPETIDLMAPALRETVARVAPEKPVLLQTWQESNQAFFAALQTERLVMFMILSLIIIVAAFNIITGQIMLVTDKTADIAILRTLGATRRQVLRVFLLNGLLLGSLGTLLGFGLGMLLVVNLPEITAFLETMTGVKLFSGDVYPVDTIPARIVWNEILSVLMMSMTLTLLASLYPAWRAARMTPVEGLRS